MSVKVKQALSKCFFQIKDNSFDEDTIRTLLIVAREFIPINSLLRELAHFIAHPARDRGMFHKRINNRYAKWKLIDDQFHSNGDKTNVLQQIRSESELSDFMLGAITMEKVDSRLFEILYFDGLEDISEGHLLQYTGFTKQKALEYLKSLYKVENRHYTFIGLELEESIARQERLVKMFGVDILKEKERIQVLDMMEKAALIKEEVAQSRKQIDHLQKVIRGTIEFTSVFSQEDFYKEIDTAFRQLITYLGLAESFIPYIQENADDILLCVMTLLHDSKFTFYDGNTARTYLCFYFDSHREASEGCLSREYNIKNVQNQGVIALYITYDVYGKTNSYPLFVSDLQSSKYFDLPILGGTEASNNFKEIPWTTATRKGKNLGLVSE